MELVRRWGELTCETIVWGNVLGTKRAFAVEPFLISSTSCDDSYLISISLEAKRGGEHDRDIIVIILKNRVILRVFTRNIIWVTTIR